MLPHPA
jgi:hypothetical protein